MSAEAATAAIADGLEATYREAGMPTRLRDLPVNKEDLPGIAAETVKNFNASGDLTTPEQRTANSLQVLEAAW